MPVPCAVIVAIVNAAALVILGLADQQRRLRPARNRSAPAVTAQISDLFTSRSAGERTSCKSPLLAGKCAASWVISPIVTPLGRVSVTA